MPNPDHKPRPRDGSSLFTTALLAGIVLVIVAVLAIDGGIDWLQLRPATDIEPI